MSEQRPSRRPRADKREAFEALFTYRMGVLMKLTDRATARAYEAATGLSLSEARAITIVAAMQPIGVQALAGYGALDKSQASRVARSLEDRGLVRIGAHPEDRRATTITLTAAGRRANETLVRIGRERNRAILAPLSATEREKLLAWMDRLVEGAQAAE